MYTVLPHDLRSLDTLADELSRMPVASRVMDHRVHVALFDRAHDDPPHYTADLDAAIALIPHGWWWHISHLEANVCPNRPEPDIPISNAIDYHFAGRPINYATHLWGERAALPAAVCAAMVRARCGLKAKAAALRDQRMYLVQTGNGPMLVDRDGRLKEMPAGAWLSEDGKLIAHKDVFPQYDFEEPEPDEDPD